jgi:hypothetical protein
MKDQTTDKPSVKHKLDAETEVLRAIASFELIKGLVVLLAGFGALYLIDRDVWDVAVSFLRLLHIKHRYHYADVFLRLARDVTDAQLIMVAVLATPIDAAFCGSLRLQVKRLGGVDCTRFWGAISPV